MKVDFFRHSLSSADASKIAAVLDTPFLTSGAVGKQVEKQLCDYFQVNGALLTNSWTNGAIAALLALDLQPGDEVIVPAMTFIATANVIEMLGAKPVFVDVHPDTLLMQPETAVSALSDKTRGIIPVHLYGQMADIQAVRGLLRKAGREDVFILEDCAHCFEGELNGAKPGSFSDAAIFSFYATKNLTCGEGGAIISNDTGLHDRMVKTRMHGMSKAAIDRFKQDKYQHWDMETLGTKANLPDLLAALLPDQIKSIDETVLERQKLAGRYREAFANGPVRLVEEVPHCHSAEHLFPIHVPHHVRDKCIETLNAHGIGTTVNYHAVPDTHYYRQKYQIPKTDYPISHDWGYGTISIPLYPGLANDAQDYVIETIQNEIYPICSIPPNAIAQG